MKKIILVALLSLSVAGMAQTPWTGTSLTGDSYRTGNVGIGNASPSEKLEVSGNIVIPFGNFIGTSGTTYKKLLQTGWDATNFDYLSFYTAGANAPDQNEKMRITMNGNVGIGTSNPKARLHVYEGTILGTNQGNFQIMTSVSGRPDNTASGYNNLLQNTWLMRSEAGNDWWKAKFHDGISLENLYATPGVDTKTWWERHPFADRQSWGSGNTPYMSLSQGRLGVGIYDAAARLDIQESNNSYSTFIARNLHTTGGGYCILSNVKQDLTKAFAVVNSTSGLVENFVVYGNGRTQIGTKKPQAPHADAMLSVDGKVACKSLYVLKPTSWADFVFEQGKIEKLSEVEEYIKANKHLPGIPSEKEIMENGYSINEIDAKLLEKVETLYLHIIELEKEIKTLKGK